MASNARQQTLALKQRLLAHGDRYSFFQAWRLLRLLCLQSGLEPDEAIRVRPRLGLGFPQTDLQGVEQRAEDRGFRVTANFLGLYGVDSPLPTFYTEDLLDEQADGHSVNREFLDILAQSIYPLFFQAWLKSKPALRVVEYGDERMLAILYAFVGIGAPDRHLPRPGVGSLLYCGALYSRQVRSAAGLQAIVQACLPEARVTVEQLRAIWLPIAPDQRFGLGLQACTLGEDSHIGGQCLTLGGLMLGIEGLSADHYKQLLPGGAEHARLRFLVDYYMVESIPVQLQLTLRAEEIPVLRQADADGRSLGADIWLVPPDYAQAARADFDLPSYRTSVHS